MAGKKMFRTDDFKSPTMRGSYLQGLFKARANAEGGTEKFGCTLIGENKDRAVLEAEVKKCIVGEWGEKGLERAAKGLIKSPFLDGDGKEAHNKKTGELNPGMGAGLFFIRPSAIFEPAVRYKSRSIQASPEEVYSGCYGFAVLNCYAWSHPTNGDGVSFGIAMFQKTGDGERLGGGGGVDVDKWYETVESSDAPAETKGGAGAGGLFG